MTLWGKIKTGIATTTLALSLLYAGCKTETPKLEQYPLSTVSIDPQYIAKKRQQTIEEIAKEAPYIGHIFYFHETQKERYIQALMNDYGFPKKGCEMLWEEIDKRKDQAFALTIMPRDYMGKGKKSYVFVFQKSFEELRKKEDLESFIVDHEGKHAEDNALGVELCGQKITPDKIDQIPLYSQIVELRAFDNQYCQIRNGRQVSIPCGNFIKLRHFLLFWALFNQKDKYAQDAVKQTKYVSLIDLMTGEIEMWEKE
ncbi:hypothetical protein KY319_04840 [Candidatus Woesearchaeota archaeon]|nr:hypothetical protein [Candidatus Woesearchaeota archaeon]